MIRNPTTRPCGGWAPIIMWVAIAATCVTSSMFLTALAPNLLAVELVRKTAQIEIAWIDWFMYFAPVGILLLAVVPLLVYWIYPPQVKEGAEVPSLGGEGAGENGAADPERDHTRHPGRHRAAAVDFRGDIMNATTAAHHRHFIDAADSMS